MKPMKQHQGISRGALLKWQGQMSSVIEHFETQETIISAASVLGS